MKTFLVHSASLFFYAFFFIFNCQKFTESIEDTIFQFVSIFLLLLLFLTKKGCNLNHLEKYVVVYAWSWLLWQLTKELILTGIFLFKFPNKQHGSNLDQERNHRSQDIIIINNDWNGNHKKKVILFILNMLKMYA